MARFIKFEDDGETVNGKPEYLVRNKRQGHVLARVCWYPVWRQWVCEPAPNTIWSQDCLADMRDFMTGLASGKAPNPEATSGSNAPSAGAESLGANEEGR